jgi:TorA maturation chaperone TorD
MQPAILVPSTLDEETARAEIYGLLAALFYAAPTPEMLANLRLAVTEAPAAGALLEGSWGELVAAARVLSAQARAMMAPARTPMATRGP